MEEIKNIKSYNEEMVKSLIDKIYFIDKTDANFFVDYGCADGTLIKFLNNLFPGKTYWGYDVNQEMLKIAKDNISASNITFSNKLPPTRTTNKIKMCFILNSVIHEVYSYGPENVSSFWQQLWDYGPDYIAIRDMMVSGKTSRPAPAKSVARVRQIMSKNIIDQWEAQWGSLDENWSLIHFFLTYKYQKNWDREYRENYLPLSYESLLNLIPPEYDIHYVNHYSLPYLVGEVWKDFYIQLQDPTHIQLILRKVKHKPRTIQTI